MVDRELAEALEYEPLLADRPLLRRVLAFFRRWDGLGLVGLGFLVILILSSLFASIVAPYDPLKIEFGSELTSPSRDHLFGTDNLGRDVFSRVIYGSRTVLYVGVTAVLVGTVVGAAIGLVSGYVGGYVDLIVQRIMDGLIAFPTLILAMVVVSVLGSSTENSIMAIATIQAPLLSRLVRGSVVSAREYPYIEAAKVIGCGPVRVMFLHIGPNVAAPIMVFSSLAIANAIIIVASLSFLGLGVPPPTADWGSMLAGDGREFMERAPWMAIFPGIAISMTVLAVNAVGDSLRDVLDPRLRAR